MAKSVPDIFVRKPGFKVKLVGDVPAVVIGVLIKANGSVMYEAAWWNGNENKSGWFQECEMLVDTETQAMRIGFN